jgi:hypothetical protein
VQQPTETPSPLPFAFPAPIAALPVQRTESAPAATAPAEPAPAAEEAAQTQGAADLEELARRVYPYVRRRLSIERERYGRS